MNQRFLLDTNVPSEFTKPSPDGRVTDWVARQENLHLSVISIGELKKGIYLLPVSKRRTNLELWFKVTLPLLQTRTLPVTEAIAGRWALLSAARQQSGAPLGVTDGLIAATAMEHDLVLVTRNVSDFANLGVAIFNHGNSEPETNRVRNSRDWRGYRYRCPVHSFIA